MHSSWVYSITGISGYVVESQKLVRNGREREIKDAQKLILACRETTESLNPKKWTSTNVINILDISVPHFVPHFLRVNRPFSV